MGPGDMPGPIFRLEGEKGNFHLAVPSARVDASSAFSAPYLSDGAFRLVFLWSTSVFR